MAALKQLDELVIRFDLNLAVTSFLGMHGDCDTLIFLALSHVTSIYRP